MVPSAAAQSLPARRAERAEARRRRRRLNRPCPDSSATRLPAQVADRLSVLVSWMRVQADGNPFISINGKGARPDRVVKARDDRHIFCARRSITYEEPVA